MNYIITSCFILHFKPRQEGLPSMTAQRTKLCSRLLMFLSKCMQKTTNSGRNPIWGKLGVTHDLGRWLVRKPIGRLCIRLNWTFFAICYDSGEAKCVRLGCFRRGSTSLHSNFTRTGSSSINHLGTRKLETLAYQTVKIASPSTVVSIQYRSLTDRQTDRRICRSIYSACGVLQIL